MIKKILVSIDFSDCSENALEIAISLARKYKSELVFYTIIPETDNIDPFSPSQNPPIKKSILFKEMEQKLQSLIEKQDCSDLKTTQAFNEGSFIPSIQKFILLNNIDLTIMGAYGMSGYNEFMIGSNALELIRISPTPMLIVKNRIENFNLNRVVFVSNFHISNFTPFKQLLDLCLPYQSEIHLLNVNTPGIFKDSDLIVESSMEMFQEYAEKKGIICHSYREGNRVIEAGIDNFISKTNPDLVVIPTHNRSPLKRLFVASIAEVIVNHVGIPIMTLKI